MTRNQAREESEAPQVMPTDPNETEKCNLPECDKDHPVHYTNFGD